MSDWVSSREAAQENVLSRLTASKHSRSSTVSVSDSDNGSDSESENDQRPTTASTANNQSNSSSSNLARGILDVNQHEAIAMEQKVKIELAQQQEWYARNNLEAHFFAAQGNAKMLAFVCKTKAHLVNKTDAEMRTPLFFAISNGHVDAVTILLQARAKVNMSDLKGFTPLHVAVRHNSLSMVKTLLSAGAKAHARDKDGRAPIHYATQCKTIKPLVELLKAPVRNHINLKDGNMMTPLHWACYFRQPNHVAILVLKGAKQDLLDVEKRTALHWACFSGSPMCAAHLLKSESAGVVNLRDRTGTAPIHLAAGNGHHNIIKVLVRVEGIEVDAVDANGRTALHWAAAAKHPDCVLALVAAGVNPGIVDKMEMTPLDYALAAECGQHVLAALSDAVQAYHNNEYTLHQDRQLGGLGEDLLPTLPKKASRRGSMLDMSPQGSVQRDARGKQSKVLEPLKETPSHTHDARKQKAANSRHVGGGRQGDASSRHTSHEKGVDSDNDNDNNTGKGSHDKREQNDSRTSKGTGLTLDKRIVSLDGRRFRLHSETEAAELHSVMASFIEAERRLRRERDKYKAKAKQHKN